jgi:hypothetical protein
MTNATTITNEENMATMSKINRSQKRKPSTPKVSMAKGAEQVLLRLLMHQETLVSELEKTIEYVQMHDIPEDDSVHLESIAAEISLLNTRALVLMQNDSDSAVTSAESRMDSVRETARQRAKYRRYVARKAKRQVKVSKKGK